MKAISKKVMAGLLVGATSLSIWAPISEAAAPENNRYYNIMLKSNPKKVWNVSQASNDNDRAILLWQGGSADNEKFAFFQLDGGAYAIVNKNSGKIVTFADYGQASWYSDSSLLPPGSLQQQSWNGAAKQKWNLRDLGSNNYEIMNQGNGKVASYAWEGTLAQNVEYVDMDNSNPSDADKVFTLFNGTANIFGQNITFFNDTISVPNLPATGTRPDAPNYTGGIDQQLPQTSNSVVVGASLIPCFMVKDNQASDYTKIHNSPYYTLVKEEYWDKTFSAVIPAGLTRNYSFKTGVTSVDQQKMSDTLSMKIGADFGIKFGDASAAIKSEISRTIQTEISTTNTEASEETISSTVTSEAGKTTGYTEYQLATKYTLKRADGSIVSDPWVVKNNKITIARKNAQ
ncbi:RICIN domain-containing protein [Bacillus toyonensis]|uniref:RICIN domain-containing protein n=2 Tax=Bacillus toyonensis TaxID=155322 RepID=UPI0018A16DEA|nr:RICIN domain-containing protein [Bacillus toyonensis]MBF7150585.1 RICIN domain-containing protein [Bacillus toyonensis]MED3188821.1 RICIN domain-containing protein [Bacillus toyonensis]